MVWQGNEKRKFPRADLSCKVIIYFPQEHAFTTHTKNIGYGGVRIVSEEDLGISSVVGMEISLDSDKIIQCKGKVVWKLENKGGLAEGKTSYDFGIEFLDIKDSDREEIKKLVDSLLQP